MECEVIHIQAEAGIIGHVEYFIHIVHTSGFAVRRHPHYLVLAIVHPETQKGGEGGVQ